MPGRTNEIGGISSRCSRNEPALLPVSSRGGGGGGTRESGADRVHVTAAKIEIRLKNKYLQGLENFLHTQLVAQ